MLKLIPRSLLCHMFKYLMFSSLLFSSVLGSVEPRSRSSAPRLGHGVPLERDDGRISEWKKTGNDTQLIVDGKPFIMEKYDDVGRLTSSFNYKQKIATVYRYSGSDYEETITYPNGQVLVKKLDKSGKLLSTEWATAEIKQPRDLFALDSIPPTAGSSQCQGEATNLLNRLFSDMHNPHTIIKNIVTKEYWDFTDHFLKSIRAEDPDVHATPENTIPYHFGRVSIISVESVVADAKVILIETVVRHDAGDLLDFETGSGISTTEWTDMGGELFDRPCEKDGIGREAFYFVKQHGTWRYHMSRLTRNPLSDAQLTSAHDGMKSLYKP